MNLFIFYERDKDLIVIQFPFGVDCLFNSALDQFI